MYAPLTYYVVFLGSMGTGEDLFYKGYVHPEEMSTHSNTHKKFLHDIGNNVYEYLFLENKILPLYTDSNIPLSWLDKLYEIKYKDRDISEFCPCL